MGQPAMTPQHGIPALGYPQQAQHPSGYPMHTPVSPMQPMAAPPAGSADLKAQRESWEKQQILQALERTSGNQKEAAKLLGISRRTLINKIEAYGIARPRKR
jgi:DNA-binding NtrC family response regulator